MAGIRFDRSGRAECDLITLCIGLATYRVLRQRHLAVRRWNREPIGPYRTCISMNMPENLTDLELWERSAKHDGAAFGLLFERHSPAVYNHCFRRTASWSSAEDLTSIVWAEVWRRRKDVRLHSDSILPWLLAVANNCLRNFDRSQRRHHHFLAKLPPASTIEFSEDAAQRMDDERTMAEVLSALSGLRIEEQEIVALCDWAGLSYAEAATALSVPIGTVRSRLSRAHGHLRVTLDNDAHDACLLTTPPIPGSPN